MKRLKVDLTAVVREDNETHILKAHFIDEYRLYFQMHNRTRNRTSPCFEIPANYGVAKWVNEDAFTRALDERFAQTRYINRRTLIHYYNTIKLYYLVEQYKEL